MRVLAGFLVALVAIGSACVAAEPDGTSDGPVWGPADRYQTPEAPNARGLLDRKGLIHAHSVYSHDACDGEPVKDGVRDPVCFDDFRRGVCQTKMDFVFLSDHRDAFDDVEFPDAVLHVPERGDKLVERDGAPIASWAMCDDDVRPALILGGAETSPWMPVGLEGHPVERSERASLYGDANQSNADVLRAAGAVMLVAHSEDRDVDFLTGPLLDGFEMFNLHALFFLKLGEGIDLALRVAEEDKSLPQPDIAILRLLTEDDRYLSRWARVMAAGHHRVTTMGTDCHRNSLPGIMSDGERIDSYRRMMGWMSNHLLVRPDDDGTWDDTHLKEALLAARLYGAFEVLGDPVGFDFIAETENETYEMGADIPLENSPQLRVSTPHVRDLDRDVDAPEITTRILRAEDNGTWTEVASGQHEVTFTPDAAGAYRAEVRMVPFHLREHLNADAAWVLDHDFVWVYSNAMQVR